MINNTNFLYRFRPPSIFVEGVEKCVSEEVAGQEIFFGTVVENNDPMDGFVNVYWEGDSVLWINFIKHYCLRLLDSSIYCDILGDSGDFGYQNSGVFRMPDDLETPEYRKMYNCLIKNVVEDSVLSKLLTILVSTKKFSFNELLALLSIFHLIFVEKVFRIKGEHLNYKVPVMFDRVSEIKKRLADKDIEKVWRELNHEKFSEFVEFANPLSQEIIKAKIYGSQYEKVPNKKVKDNFWKWLGLFPDDYLKWEANRVFPEYYLASFSRDCQNSSMWGHYAKGHKGICLVFDFSNNFVELDNGGLIPLKDVKYDFPIAVNYFENLSSFSAKAVHEFWLRDDQVNSLYSDHYKNEDVFREKYWDLYDKKGAFKFVDWGYEKEVRAVMPTMHGWEEERGKRLKKYKLSQLKGIIFGLQTADDLKYKIIKLINEKFPDEQRKEFKFYEARYSEYEKKLKIHALFLQKLL